MPLVETRGAASAQGFGEFAQATAVPVFIEDTFSTTLYTGNSSTQTITNGIDLSTKGGLVWIKRRTSEAHYLFDTSRGVLDELNTDGTGANETKANSLTSFNTTGFSLGSYGGSNYSVAPNNSYVSWTWRKQPKYFDIQTWTGTGSNTTISHSLGAVPACIIVKRTDTTSDWQVYHRSLANTEYLVLNLDAAKATGATRWNSTTPTSTVFSLGTDATVNASAGTYVAYLFAHDAGGFGLTGTDNVISCGSYTGNGSATGPVVTLGYEPQWVMVKQSSASGQWWNMIDVMRGFDVSNGAQTLGANAADAEYTNAGFGSGTPIMSPTATGFQVLSAQSATNASGATYIYIAIRRPMKVPTSGTSVYNAITRTGTAAAATVTGVGFPPDLMIVGNKTGTSGVTGHTADRLRGKFTALRTNATAAEISDSSLTTDFLMDGVSLGSDSYDYGLNKVMGYVNWFFKRAPSFFDEVCYTGTGSARTVSHNLAAVPEMMIVKLRNTTQSWAVYHSFIGNTASITLNSNSGNINTSSSVWNNTSPTSSIFSVGSGTSTNGSGYTFVAYLFATCAGVSKVFSYTGNGSSQTINCGFTGGARFLLIKRVEVDVSGDWYVWDTARGIVAGNDPHLSLNTADAEVTTDDTIDTDSTGFVVNQVSATNVNVSSATYIGLAIA